MIDVPTALDAAKVTAAFSRRCCAVVLVAIRHHFCDVAVAAPRAAPVNPQSVVGRLVQLHTCWTAGTCHTEVPVK